MTLLEDLFGDAFDSQGRQQEGTKMKSSRPGILSALFVTAVGCVAR